MSYVPIALVTTMITKYCALFALVLPLAACGIAQLNPNAAHVEISSVPIESDKCEYRGEVIGSEGHWYTYLFISNRSLMQAAVDDLRNQAAAKGANIVYIDEPQDFASSVTLLGLAYRCGKKNS